ncbi:MAG: hypothetical protein R3C60_10200 [Parvularculaceae bacterium]
MLNPKFETLKRLNSYKPPHKDLRDIPWQPDDICPCGRNKLVRDCCQFETDFGVFHPPSLQPSGPPTNFSNPRCCLAFTGNCSKTISSEHYFSKNVLERLGRFSISGTPWLERGQEQEIGINRVTANILCKRHNESLSPIDQLGGNAILTITDAIDYLAQKGPYRRSAYGFFSGHMLELWALKVLLGMVHGKVMRGENSSLIDPAQIPVSFLRRAFYEHQIESPAGFYIQPTDKPLFPMVYQVIALFNASDNCLAGLKIRVKGLEFWFPFFPDEDNARLFENLSLVHRPLILDLVTPKRSVRLMSNWPSGPGTYKRVAFGAK